MGTRYRLIGPTMRMTRDTAPAQRSIPTRGPDDDLERLARAASNPNRSLSERLEASNSLHTLWWKRHRDPA
jgi:hypothetical protein